VSSELEAVALVGALLVSVGLALTARRVSVSLISMFYAAIFLGLTFTVYGDALLGLLTMITFAGAVSVLLLTVILITGEPDLPLGAKRLGTALVLSAAAAGSLVIFVLLQGQGGTLPTSDSSLQVLAFAWTLRPWDMLILVVVFAGAMVGVASLLGVEK